MNNFKERIEDFKNKHILVIGDVMLDEYIFGKISRISPEAPVPIVKVSGEKTYIPGGASNVSANIASLGGKVTVYGITGDDDNAKILEEELNKRNIDYFFIKDETKPTITKTRITGSSQGHRQQILRIDNEDRFEVDQAVILKICEKLSKDIKQASCIILSDYNKGVLTKELSSKIIEIAKKANVAVVVDPKPDNIDYFQDCTLVAPNLYESEGISGIKFNANDVSNSLQKMAGTILKKIKSKYVIITCGKQGMFSYDNSGKFELVETKAKEIINVTGAGDSVIAALALSFKKGSEEVDIHQAADLANHVAGIAVSKAGTTAVTSEELIKSLE